MNLISFFVKRPIATSMILLIVLFFGFVGLLKIPVDLFPNVTHPQFSVVTTYENASANEIEKNITKPLEEELSFLKNLSYLSSTSEEGLSRIQLFFQWGTHMDFATLEAREKIDLVKSNLPEEADDPMIERFNPNAQPILVVHLTGKQTEEDLRSTTDSKIKPVLERIQGVAQVKLFGGTEQEIEVKLNPNHLKSHGISIQDVIDSLKSENVSTRGGLLREGTIDLLIKVSGEIKSLDDIENTIVAKKNQIPIMIKNLGQIRLTSKRKKDYALLNEKPAVSLEVYKEPSGNALSIIDRFFELSHTLEAESHLKFVVTYNQADYIKDSLSMVKGNAIQGAFLTIAVLFIFLRSISATMIVTLSIPFSVIASLFLLYISGISLNLFSLAGIALTLGMVVDASIVILENIFEHMKNQENPKGAAVRATVEVGGAVMASTLTTLAVFIPILFIKGPMGLIFRDLSLAIIFGLIFSMFISFSFVPMISSRFLKISTSPKGIQETLNQWKKIVFQGLSLLDAVGNIGTKMFRIYEKIFRRFKISPQELYQKAVEKTVKSDQKIQVLQQTIEKEYTRTLKEALKSWKSRISVIVTVFALFFISMVFLPKTEFLPESMQLHYEIHVTHPTGTSLVHTYEIAKKIASFIATLPLFESAHVNVSAAKSTFVTQFSHPKKVSKSLTLLQEYLKRIPDVHFQILAMSPINAITAGMQTRAIDFKIKGPEIQILKEKGMLLAQRLKEMKEVVSAASLYEEGKPEIKINIDRDKASDFALTAEMISDNLKNQLYGIKATDVTMDGNDLPVVVRTQTGALDTAQKLSDLLIPSPMGVHVPLQTIASFEETFSPSQLQREEKERTLTVFASVNPKSSPQKIIENIQSPRSHFQKELNLPEEYSLQVGPLVKTFLKSFSQLKIALIIALVLIYMIMAAQFESLIDPFTILFSVPLSLIGVIFSLVITGTLLSLPACIGIIILAGISVNNAIVLIDYVNILRHRGMDREDALLEAGKRRLRPILMTSLTTILGMLPLALGFGSGTELYQPLAIVMVGGMISSTFLTLLFIPTIYCFFDDLGDILGLMFLKIQLFFPTWKKQK